MIVPAPPGEVCDSAVIVLSVVIVRRVRIAVSSEYLKLVRVCGAGVSNLFPSESYFYKIKMAASMFCNIYSYSVF